MQRDHYDILDIPENASHAWIEKAYQKRLLALESNTALKAKKRVAALAEISEAYRVLGDDGVRLAYDAELLKIRETANEPSALVKMVRMALLVGLPLIAAGTYFYMDSQAKARVQQERAEQIAETQRLEAQQQRFEKERVLAEERDRLDREKAERDRIESIRIAHEEVMRNGRFIPLPTLDQQARDKQNAELVERGRQLQEEIERRKTLAELERQKRFLRDAQR